MGRGTYGNGQIELYATTIETVNDPQTIQQWKSSFQEASCMLYRATGKKAWFAKVYLYTNVDSVVTDADAQLDDTVDRSGTFHPLVLPEAPADLCQLEGTCVFEDGYVVEDFALDPDRFDEGRYMLLGRDAYTKPFVVLHEFGHYGFWLGDEYDWWDPTIKCSQEQRTQLGVSRDEPNMEQACIMGAPVSDNVTRFIPDNGGYRLINGWIVEFCNKDNHDGESASSHNERHEGKSCEYVMKEYRENIDVAAAVALDPMTLAPVETGTVCPTIVWAGTSNELLYAPVIDDGLVPGLDAGLDGIYEAAEYHIAQSAGFADDDPLLKFGGTAERRGFKTMPGVQDALDLLANRFGMAGDRPLEQAVLLFSTGREPVLHARRVAVTFAEQGVRVFTVGLGRDRASLQQLAQRTKAAYFEVDVGDPPTDGTDGQLLRGQSAQLVRNYMVNTYERLRSGAPVAIFPRERFDGDSENGDLKDGAVRVRVEEGSRRLKFVLTQTPGSHLDLRIHPPGGEAVDRGTPKFESTDEGGFQTASVENPTGGVWSVELLRGDSAGLDLSVYSANPRVHVGVTGWRRLRIVGETVRLQVVVRAPLPIAELDVARVLVTPPRGSENPTFERALVPQGDGVHTAMFPVTEAGAYGVEMRLRHRRREREPDALIPEFERADRFQIHVAAPVR